MIRRSSFLPALLLLAYIAAPARVARAHPEGFSGLRVLVSSDKAHAVLTLHTRDLTAWFPPAKYPDYVADVSREMARDAGELLEVRADGAAIPPAAVRVSSPEVGLIQFEADYPWSAPPAMLEIWSKHLVRLPGGHQQLLFVERSGATLAEDTLSVDHDSASVELAAQSATRPSASPSSRHSPPHISFFLLGIEHIVTGYDHLLFLAALLLVCRSFREAAAVITFFTIAHSITLSLAALDIVRLPPRIVEPAIAASIVYVGLENIFGRHRFGWRAGITFAFGLVHGLGFAAALREVGLGSTSLGVALPLLKFSIGLETGQLTIAAVILWMMLWLRTRPQFQRRWVPACSMIVSLIGGYWLVTRLLSG